MNKNKRKKVEQYILKNIAELEEKGTYNVEVYKDLFKRLTDAEFHSMMEQMRDGTMMVSLISPHSKPVVTFPHAYKLVEKNGMKVFHHLTIEMGDSVTVSPIQTQVFLLPNRRTRQVLLKGISVPKNGKTRDTQTGTVTGASSSGKLIFEEVKILNGLGLESTIYELYNVRGGDKTAESAMMKYADTGSPELKYIKGHAGGVQSTKTLRWMLATGHIKLEV